MNRRAFLSILLGAASIPVIGIAPTELDAEMSLEEFQAWLTEMINPVLNRYISDFMTYGRAAIGYIDEPPYIRNIPFEEWLKYPELLKSTGDY